MTAPALLWALCLFFYMVLLPASSLSQPCQWQMVDSSASAAYFDIDCSGSGECASVGLDVGRDQPFIQVSRNRGLSWERLSVDSLVTAKGLYVPGKRVMFTTVSRMSPNRIIVAGGYGVGFVSEDGGGEWRSFDLGEDINDMVMSDSVRGIAVSSHRVFVTDDAWRTHSVVPGDSLFEPGFINQIAFVRNDSISVNVFVPPLGGYLLRTDDFGQSWQRLAVPHMLDIEFSDYLSGWGADAIGNDTNDLARDVIYRSTDGGELWTNIIDTALSPEMGLQGVSLHGTQTVAVSGAGPKLWFSLDGGRSWSRCESLSALTSWTAVMDFDDQGALFMALGFPTSGIVRVELGTSAVINRSEGLSRRLHILPNKVRAGDLVTIQGLERTAQITQISLVDITGRASAVTPVGYGEIRQIVVPPVTAGLYWVVVAYEGVRNSFPLLIY